MIKNKAAENSAFATSSSGAAASPAKASPLKTSRSRKATPAVPVLAPVTGEVANPVEVPIESTTRTSKPKTPRAKSTALTHRHKKLETTPVAADLRVEIVRDHPAEPTNEDIAKLAYSYYVDRGYQSGNPADDWFRAVAELRARLNP